MPAARARLLFPALLLAGLAAGPGAPAQGLGNNTLLQPIPDGTPRMMEGGPRPSALRVLPPGDHDLYARAFAAAGRGDWAAARNLAAQGRDPLARQLLEWRYALDIDSGASFGDIDAVMKATRGWPLPGTLQARGERA